MAISDQRYYRKWSLQSYEVILPLALVLASVLASVLAITLTVAVAVVTAIAIPLALAQALALSPALCLGLALTSVLGNRCTRSPKRDSHSQGTLSLVYTVRCIQSYQRHSARSPNCAPVATVKMRTRPACNLGAPLSKALLTMIWGDL